MPEPLFRDEDLREMERRTLDRLVEAIDAGRPEEAKRIAQRMFNEFLGMHDLYRDWIAATLGAVARRWGNDGLDAVMHEGVAAWWEPASKVFADPDEPLAKRIRMFVAGLRGHLQPLHIEEDAEKVVIEMRPCGSGGRQIREGRYEGPQALHTVQGPHHLTYGRPEFPVYCAHEAAMEAVGIDAHGRPFVVVEPAADLATGHCRFIVYKDPGKVPERYYRRVGRRKPEEGAEP